MKLTVGLEHEPGEELQLDWLELSETPWGAKAYVLVGALSHSSRLRGCFAEGESFPHLAEALDGVLPAGSAAAPAPWRTDRMATWSSTPARTGCGPRRRRWPSTTAFRLRSVRRCGRSARVSSRKRSSILTQSWWRSAPVSSPAQAQADLDRWCVAVSDGAREKGGAGWGVMRRRRGQSTVSELAASEPLLALPELPFGAEYRETRVVSREALVEFESNRYRVAPGTPAHGRGRARLGELHLEIYTPTGRRIARHRRALAGAGQTIRTDEHAARARAGRALPVHQPQGVRAQTEPAARRASPGGGRKLRGSCRRNGRRSGEYARTAKVAGR